MKSILRDGLQTAIQKTSMFSPEHSVPLDATQAPGNIILCYVGTVQSAKPMHEMLEWMTRVTRFQALYQAGIFVCSRARPASEPV